MPRLTSPPRVLVVDDDRTVCEFLGDCLRRRESGCVVETAGTGAGAIDAVHRRRPDLVLLDVGLPDLSGLDVLRLIRQLNPGLPVIIITGARDPRAAAEAMQSGAFALIPKPFNAIYVENLVEAALEAG